MLCKLQYDRINNNTKIMCLKKDYTFFWLLVYIDNDINHYIFGLRLCDTLYCENLV